VVYFLHKVQNIVHGFINTILYYGYHTILRHIIAVSEQQQNNF